MKITVVGSGYVGLVTGACLADKHDVTCYDTSEHRIKCLEKGILPFYEGGLEEKVKDNVAAGRLSFCSQERCLCDADVIFICVGTPSNDDGTCDLKYVQQAAYAIAKTCVYPKTVVMKSTVPPGTCHELMSLLYMHRYVSNPEFLREGSAVQDCLKPDRIVVGVQDEESLETMEWVYDGSDKLVFMDILSAELAKYACNCALAAKISFINEMSNICEVVGAKIQPILKVMAADPRIGKEFYQPGPGYGGSCFPKDVKAMAHVAQKLGIETHLLREIDFVNEQQQKKLFEKLAGVLDLTKDQTVAIWGAAFKPGTDDIRKSPVLPLIDSLLEYPIDIQVHDPEATDSLYSKYSDCLCIDYYATDKYAAAHADILVIVTDWPEYIWADISKIEAPIIIDARNVLNADEVRRAGKVYIGFGNA